MKTKIVYISGNEIFEMADIRAAFEEVRTTLNLDKDTVLFGVPVDNDDAGLMKSDEIKIPEPDVVPHEIIEPAETTDDAAQDDIVVIDEEPVIDEPVKKRGRARKVKPVENTENSEPVHIQEDVDEKIVPILSVLSSNDEPDVDVQENVTVEAEHPVSDSESDATDIEIIEDIVQKTEITIESDDAENIENTDTMESIDDTEDAEDTEPDLEKLLSAMKPLQEDVLGANTKSAPQPVDDDDDEEDIDATLEQLATEFVQTQDKIASESKSSGRGRIGKLRNILPFKQSKHKDQGLGDLFGWAGVAANDEDFSVPGFFTKTPPKE